MADITNYDDIKKVLEQHGFSENQDFMFVDINSETDFMFDGVPMYRVANYQNKTTVFYSEQLKRDLTLYVISDFRMGPESKQTSSNNGVYAVYLKKYGFIFTTEAEIKFLMEREFGFRDTHFGIPLSNGAQFRNEKQQAVWKKILLNDGTKKAKQKMSVLEQNTMQALSNQGMDK